MAWFRQVAPAIYDCTSNHVSRPDVAVNPAHRTASGTLSLDSHCPTTERCTVAYAVTAP